MTDEAYILATAPLMRVLADLSPEKRTRHLADYAERRAGEIQEAVQLRRELETWPAPEPREAEC